jgi:hypothetical protein
MQAPLRNVRLMTRDQETEVVSIHVPETYEPYDVVIWHGRFFIPNPHAHDNEYHEAVSFCAINGG